MTDLQKMYLEARMKGASPRGALRAIAVRTGIDEGSVARALKRAGTKVTS